MTKLTQETNDVVGLIATLRHNAKCLDQDPEFAEPCEEAADALQSQSARIAELEGERRAVESQKGELQMLLVRYGDHDAIKKAGKTWPEAQKVFEGRCLKCGGTHLGMPGGCDGPPTPSRPHPHARDMIA